MRFGDLNLYVGPMFAGKTSHLIREILYRTYFDGSEQEPVGLFVPHFDTRSGARFETHDGARVAAWRISQADEIPNEGLRYAFFDEVQFFAEPHFEGDFSFKIRRLRESGVDVHCAGLDMDYLGRAFEVTAQLMAESTRIHRLTAECLVCGAPATHTSRQACGNDRFAVGAEDIYAPKCARHWHESRISGRGQ